MPKRKREEYDEGDDEEEEAEEKIAVYVDTSIDTHLIVHVSPLLPFSLLKQEIVSEHKNYFPEYEEIKIDGIKVKQDNKHYHMPESMPIRTAFCGERTPCVMADVAGTPTCGLPSAQLISGQNFQSNTANWQNMSQQHNHEPEAIPTTPHPVGWRFQSNLANWQCLSKQPVPKDLEGNNTESGRALNQESENAGGASGSDALKNKKKKKKKKSKNRKKRKLNVDEFSTMRTANLDQVHDIINDVVAAVNSENPTYEGESDENTTGEDREPGKLTDGPMLHLPGNKVHNSGETVKHSEKEVASVTFSDMKGRIPSHENSADSAGAPCGSQVKTAKKTNKDDLNNLALEKKSGNVTTGEDRAPLQLTDSRMLHFSRNEPPNTVEKVMESGKDAALLKAPDMMGRTLSHTNSVDNSGGPSESQVKKAKRIKKDDASVDIEDPAYKRRSDNVTATEEGEAVQTIDCPMNKLSQNEPHNLLEKAKESEKNVAMLKAPRMRGRTLSHENSFDSAGVPSESRKKKVKKTKKDDVSGVMSKYAASFDLMPDMASNVVVTGNNENPLCEKELNNIATGDEGVPLQQTDDPILDSSQNDLRDLLERVKESEEDVAPLKLAGMKETTHSEQPDKKKKPTKAKSSIKETELPNTRRNHDTPNKNTEFPTRHLTGSQSRGFIPIKCSNNFPSRNVSADSGEESELLSKVHQAKVDIEPVKKVSMMAQTGGELLQPAPISTPSDNVEARTMKPKYRAPNMQFIPKMDSPKIIAEEHVCGEQTGMVVQKTVDVHPPTYMSSVENRRESEVYKTPLQKSSAEVEEVMNLDKEQRWKLKKNKLVFPSVDASNGYYPVSALGSVDAASRQEDLTVSDKNRQRESTGASLPRGSKKKREKYHDSLPSVDAASKQEDLTRRDSVFSVEALSKQKLPVTEKSVRTEKSSLDTSLLHRSDDRTLNYQMGVSLPAEEVPSLVSRKNRHRENTSSGASLPQGSKKKWKKDHESFSSLDPASKQEDLTVSSKTGKREKPSSDADLPLASNLKAKNRDSVLSVEAAAKEDLPVSEKSGRSEKNSTYRSLLQRSFPAREDRIPTYQMGVALPEEEVSSLLSDKSQQRENTSSGANFPQGSKQKSKKDLDSLSSVRPADSAPKQEDLTVSSKKGQREKPSTDASLPRASKGKVKNRESLSSADASSKHEDLTLSIKSGQKGTTSNDVSLPLKAAPERDFNILPKPDAKYSTVSKEVVETQLLYSDPGSSDVPSRKVSADVGKETKLTSKASQAKVGSPLNNVEARAVEPKKRSKNKQFTSKMNDPKLPMQELVGEEQTGMAVQKIVALGENGVKHQNDSQRDGFDETSSQQVSAEVGEVRNLDKSRISKMKKKKLDCHSSVDTSSKTFNDSTVLPKAFPERGHNRLPKHVLKHSTVSKEVDTKVPSSVPANTVARGNDKIETVLRRAVSRASSNDGSKSSKTSDASSGSSGQLTHHGKNEKQIQKKDDLHRIDFITPGKNPVVNASSQKKGWSSGGVLLGDLSSGSSDDEEEDLAYGSSSSTRTPSDNQYSSDYSSGGETQGDMVTSQPATSRGGKKDQTISNASDGKKYVNLESLMKSSSRFKKAKQFADSQPQDGESEPPEFVPDSQA